MGLNSAGSFAKVWEIRQGKGNYYDVRISISKKTDDGYENSFNAWARFCGKAKEKISQIKEKDVIKITSFDVTNSYSKEDRKEYTNYAVFDFDTTSNNKPSTPSKAPDEPMESAPNIEDRLPF